MVFLEPVSKPACRWLCLLRDILNIPVIKKVFMERFKRKYPVRKSMQTEFSRLARTDDVCSNLTLPRGTAMRKQRAASLRVSSRVRAPKHSQTRWGLPSSLPLRRPRAPTR
jgi:hypothetical protein